MGDFTMASSISVSTTSASGGCAGAGPAVAATGAAATGAAAATAATGGGSVGVGPETPKAPTPFFRTRSRNPSCSTSNSARSCSLTSSRICFSWSRSKSNLNEICRRVGQNLHAAAGHEHIVLDPDAAPAGQIGARLDREHHARLYSFVAGVDIGSAPCDPRALMDLDAQTVPRPVTESGAQPVPVEGVAGRGVDLEPRSTGGDHLDRPIVRFADGVIHLAHARGREADGYGPGQVDAV